MEKLGILYVIATPIGNLEDFSLRAKKTIEDSDIVLCEDTRSGKKLFKLTNIKYKRLVSFFEHSEERKIPAVVDALKQGKNISLLSKAGTPLISDPGFKLVRQCVKEKIRVSPIPGPSAVISALSISGLPTDKFVFLGFLPKKQGKRILTLEKYKDTQKSIKTTGIIYSNPRKAVETLKDIKSVFGNINVCVALELTKMHERAFYGCANEVVKMLEKDTLKGEATIVFNPNV